MVIRNGVPVSKALGLACVTICLLFVAGVVAAQSKGTKPAADPTAFYEDCGDDRSCSFDSPVPLPDNVLNALRTSEQAKSMQDELKGLDRERFTELFKAVKIHLGETEELDYVILSEFPMGGANAPWFWIVRSNQTHPEVIFFTFANGFELLKARNNGFPNIRSNAWAGGVQYTNVYLYNGQRYILVHKYHKEVR